jgi:hypothetical protein
LSRQWANDFEADQRLLQTNKQAAAIMGKIGRKRKMGAKKSKAQIAAELAAASGEAVAAPVVVKAKPRKVSTQARTTKPAPEPTRISARQDQRKAHPAQGVPPQRKRKAPVEAPQQQDGVVESVAAAAVAAPTQAPTKKRRLPTTTSRSPVQATTQTQVEQPEEEKTFEAVSHAADLKTLETVIDKLQSPQLQNVFRVALTTYKEKMCGVIAAAASSPSSSLLALRKEAADTALEKAQVAIAEAPSTTTTTESEAAAPILEPPPPPVLKGGRKVNLDLIVPLEEDCFMYLKDGFTPRCDTKTRGNAAVKQESRYVRKLINDVILNKHLNDKQQVWVLRKAAMHPKCRHVFKSAGLVDVVQYEVKEFVIKKIRTLIQETRKTNHSHGRTTDKNRAFVEKILLAVANAPPKEGEDVRSTPSNRSVFEMLGVPGGTGQRIVKKEK